MNKIKSGVFIALCCLFLASMVSAEQERITDYYSDINLYSDGTMRVEENIRVYCAGEQIKRGIYRDFPTRYKDQLGHNYVVGFKVIKVLRDRVPEDYHTENLSNGVRVYVGSRDVFLSPGYYTYTIVYETNRQVGFFKDHDELYWNVTGNGWGFQIEKASATVELPETIPHVETTFSGYTGPYGSTATNFVAFWENPRRIKFEATLILEPAEGLTIVVTWPKGYIDEPTFLEKLKYFLSDNQSIFRGSVGILIVFFYYLFVWVLVGRDPRKGTIIPLYKPPEDLSPADMRYIMRMGFDNKCFTATVLSLAVKGYLSIHQKDSTYTLKKLDHGKDHLSNDEKKVMKKLLGDRSSIILKNTNHSSISSAIKGLKTSLFSRYHKRYFFSNKKYFGPGVILSILAAIASGFSPENLGAIFMVVWLSFWSIGVFFLLLQVGKAWKAAITGDVASKGGALFLTLFSLPFIGGEIFGLFMLSQLGSVMFLFIILCLIFLNIIFYKLLKAPTRAGRKVMDQIEGFKMYLNVAEKPRMDMLMPPTKSPDVFEKYLPFALALGVEQRWAEYFSDVISPAGKTDQSYQPSWYHGSSWGRLGAVDFTSNLSSSFTTTISSASTPPGSRSGSSGGGFSSGGGGGFSGGGGGGGGGGGW
ncbi:DUF2207 domain-containing protein [candidate division KSB1 bacterium]|nr:DUF2207 domain-containing protein [candidate division KSB1 bacterium]